MGLVFFIPGQTVHGLGEACALQTMECSSCRYVQRNRIWDKFVPIKILIILLISSLKYYSRTQFCSQFTTGAVFLKLSPVVSFVKHCNLLSDGWIVTSCCCLSIALLTPEVQQIFIYLLDICLFSVNSMS